MRILKKRILLLTLTVLLLCSTIFPAFADSLDNAKESNIQPRWTEISQFNNSLILHHQKRADIKSNMSALVSTLLWLEPISSNLKMDLDDN